MNLFNQKILRERIARFDFPRGEAATEKQKIIANWQFALKERDLTRTKEKSIQGQFLTKFFCEVLGYAMQTGSEREWNLTQHPTTEVDAQEADGSLGFFTRENKVTKAVIELKDAKSSLDKKQTGREKGYTPIEQAQLYAMKFDRCNWIIVSNFREIRLYNKNRTQDYYEKFDVLELHKEEEFKRFYYILCKQNLISTANTSIIDDLANDSSKEDENITLKFYKDYKHIRTNVFNHLTEHNPDIEKIILLEKAQKILDRFIFILFCEDTGNLLPRNLVKETYSLGIRSRERSDQKVWREFKNLFMDIDMGRSDIDPKINQYNGGLFAKDDILDNLTIKDTIWKELIDLNRYDFESELNVNILGHIFEQSISDLEALRTSIHLTNGNHSTTENGNRLATKEEETKTAKKNGRRKKDGIFYTPEFITKYIVEHTIEKFLEENPEKLETIKILDPACGSGAFLNQAHTYLRSEYKNRFEEKLLEKSGIQQLDFSYVNLAETNRSILLNNLFGVDLNQESVEITKLSLWLKTASSSEPLQNLDKNIKCGNSIIEDELIVGNKAFNWNQEFREIISDGGFDILVENPPWGASLSENEKNFIYKSYASVEYQIDTYVVFIEKALNLLKQDGYLGMIIPSTWLSMHYFQKIRQLLIETTTLKEVILFRHQVFENVTAETSILICKKTPPAQDSEITVSYVDRGEQLNNLKNHYVKQKTWQEEVNNGFNVFYDEEAMSLVRSISQNNTPLNSIAEITIGIKPYQTNKGTPKQSKEDVENRIYDSKTKLDESYKPYVVGGDISKYHINEPTGKWIKYGSWLAEPRQSIDFNQPKIVIRQTSDKIIAALDTVGYLNLNNVHNLLIKNNQIEYKYLLAVLNSSLTDFIYRYLVPEQGRVFAEVKTVNLQKLPISIPSKEKQTEIVNKVEKMEENVNKYYQILHNIYDFLLDEFKIDSLTRKIIKFNELGWNEFIEELEKQKINLDLKRKEELNQWFRSKQSMVKDIQRDIHLLSKEIDSAVFDAFELTNEERLIITNFK